MLCYNEPWSGGDGRVLVLPYPDATGLADLLQFECTSWACDDGWGRMTKYQRQWCMNKSIIEKALLGDVPLLNLHNAALVVPEYRSMVFDWPKLGC